MTWVYKIIRSILIVILVALIGLPAIIFVVLSLPGVQKDISRRASEELSTLLAMNVHIDEVAIAPFNRVTLRRVTLTDSSGDTAVAVRRLGAGINLFDLIVKHRIVVDYTEIIGLDARLRRDSLGSRLNIQPMIDALKPKDKSKPPTLFDLRVNTVVMRKSSVSYDVLSLPVDSSRFDRNHILVSDLRADIRLPRIKNDDFTIDLRRLAFTERSGFVLNGINGMFHITPQYSTVTGMNVELAGSDIRFDDMELKYDSWDDFSRSPENVTFHGGISEGSYLSIADAAPFVPVLKDMDASINVQTTINGSLMALNIEDLDLTTDDGNIWVRLHGCVMNVLRGRDEVAAEVPSFSIGGYGADIADIIQTAGNLSPVARTILLNMGHVKMTGDFSGSIVQGAINSQLIMEPGRVSMTGDYRRNGAGPYTVNGSVAMDGFDCGVLFDESMPTLIPFGPLSCEVQSQLLLKPGLPDGHIKAHIENVEYRGWSYEDFNLLAVMDKDRVRLSADIDDNDLAMQLDADMVRDPDGGGSIEATLDVRNFNLSHFTGKGENRRLAFNSDIDIYGPDLDRVLGQVNIRDISYLTGDDKGLRISSVALTSQENDSVRVMKLRSDIIDGELQGAIGFTGLMPQIKSIASTVFPGLIGMKQIKPQRNVLANDFTFEIDIKDSSPFKDLVSLPVSVIYPISIKGNVDYPARSIQLCLDAPYIQQKDKLLENTVFNLGITPVNDSTGRMDMNFSMLYPTKKGDMTIQTSAYGRNDRIDTKFDWRVARDREFTGDVNLTAAFDRGEDHRLITTLFVNPGNMVFNDTVWTIDPSKIEVDGNRISVNDFRVGRNDQYIAIDGVASASDDESLTLSLQNVNLDYIFETLDIGNAMFGGIATGVFHASSVMSKAPKLFTDGLNVQNLKYNHSLMGDAKIISYWIPDIKAIEIDAEIKQPNGCSSYINGQIMPLNDSLDFRFDADKIEIGFMKPFMEAFTSEVSGYASGKARLWGTFKYIDMVGDIYAQDVKLKLDFTNTYYIATDSVRLTPGRIDLDHITLRDIYGHTADLNGWITHKFFKQPEFNFSITHAENMLVYDVPETPEDIWYGRIFGNGSATINGVPGLVDINVNMSTAPNSTFTFVLSDAEQAYEYDFITFRDRDQAIKDSLSIDYTTPRIVQELKNKVKKNDNDGGGSIYKMNISVDVTPSALVTLVMDPVGGDRIKAYGSGNLRMTYDSADEDLRMFGTYTLSRGSYNFTLQDIIIKDFTIKDGSSITFHGDPYAAQLDIEAVYSVNANLSDLDDSFLDDKELNRTNVPVHALLQVRGDMRQPDIGFDLEFPTLTQDTYRKVRSIISTDDMMNRQIIYLLALSRFYTPDYMSTTKGNELVSMASSTISSQLSNILGQLSDNWTIAPNFRSDRGDFSDVEIDLALSSHLLNNRLLFNGNFGYRDKSMNNNTFVGDFDLEYLLNRNGNLRLKAYNRYNDQNYYLKSALTTQGVGVVYRRDFDNIFSFLRPRRKKAETETRPDTVEAIITDTITIEMPDSLSHPIDITH